MTADQRSLVAPPFRPADLDINIKLVTELVLRRTLLDETTSIRQLSINLGLAPVIIEAVFEILRNRKYLDVHGLAGTDYTFSLTDTGRQQAIDRFQQCRYAGVAPVSLRRYWQVVLAQRPATHIDREVMQNAFSDLVTTDDILAMLGPAMVSNSSMLMYGPSGTGKTSLAERLVRVYDDYALIPHSVEADGQIITVYDPAVHHPLPEQPAGLDPRWVACQRPLVTVGGELTFSMLQLSYDAQAGVYGAPLQMKANNGIFLVDDFGRQTIEPEALLNRWIIPLDRRLDYMALNHGVQFAIPFEMVVVFSTNLDPTDLGDEAFFRRIANKVFIGPVSDDVFDWVMARVTQAMGIDVESGLAGYARRLCREMGSGDLRPCYPRDLCRLLKSVCQYEGTALAMTRENLERAARLYFNAPLPGEESRERARSMLSAHSSRELVEEPPAWWSEATPPPGSADLRAMTATMGIFGEPEVPAAPQLPSQLVIRPADETWADPEAFAQPEGFAQPDVFAETGAEPGFAEDEFAADAVEWDRDEEGEWRLAQPPADDWQAPALPTTVTDPTAVEPTPAYAARTEPAPPEPTPVDHGEPETAGSWFAPRPRNSQAAAEPPQPEPPPAPRPLTARRDMPTAPKEPPMDLWGSKNASDG